MSGVLARRLAAGPTALLLAVGLSVALGPEARSTADAATVASSSAVTGQRVEMRRGSPRAFKISRLDGGDGPRVGWRHCRRINYRVNYDHAPRRSKWHVNEAMRRLKRATGMHYRYVGRTRARPNPKGRGYPGATKLVVGWGTPRSKWLAPGAAGVGGWAARSNGAIVRGFVLINYRVKMAPGFGRGPREGVLGTRGQVLMHEMAHTVGLAHVREKAQIMYRETTRKMATWGAGDWRGLRKQGRRAGCF